MGFHVCEYCNNETSSGDVILAFRNGNIYVMPDMIIHYVEQHDYQPPQSFIEDVMSGQLANGERRSNDGWKVTQGGIGYLSGEYLRGSVPHLFIYVLAGMMALAAKQGNRRQTRGL